VFSNSIKQEDSISSSIEVEGEEEIKSPKPLFEIVDISTLILNSGFEINDLSSMDVCPTLDLYRDKLNITDSSYGLFDNSDYSKYFPQHLIAASSSSRGSIYNITDVDEGNAVDYGDEYVGGDEYFGGDDDNDDDNDIINLSSNDEETYRKSLSSRQSISGSKINWDTVFDKNDVNDKNNNDDNNPLNDNEGSNTNDVRSWTEGGISNRYLSYLSIYQSHSNITDSISIL
jgi:hypothetical protein